MAHACTVKTTITQPSPEIIQAIGDQLRDSRAELAISTPSSFPSTTRALPSTPLAEELDGAIENSRRILTRYRARLTGEQPQEHPITRPHTLRIQEPTATPSQAFHTPNHWLGEVSTGGIVRQELFPQFGSGAPPSPPNSPPDSPHHLESHHSSHSSGSHSSSANSSPHYTPPRTPQGSPNRTPSPPPDRNMANRPWLDQDAVVVPRAQHNL